MIFLRMFCGFLVQVLPFAFLCFYPFQNHFRYARKLTILATTSIILFLAALFSAMAVYLNANMPQDFGLWQAVNLVFMCCLLPCLVWYLYAIEAIWQKKLFVFSFSTTCALAMTSICNIVATKMQLQHSDHLPYYGFALPILLGITILTMPLFRLLLKRAYLPVEMGLSGRESGYLSVMSVVLAAILASGLSYIGINLLLNPMSLFLFLALMISIFIIYYVIFKMLAFAHERLETVQKYAEIQQQLAIHEEQYRKITDNVENSRRLRHDLRHHMVALQEFLNAGQTDEAIEYLSEYVSNLSKYELPTLCENPVIDMVINHYRALAMENQIAFTIRVDLPKYISIEDSDISVLIGNLLENAIEAANHMAGENRYIHLNIIRSGKMLAITVDNGFDGNVKLSGKQYLSTKSKQHTGLGLQSVKSIAEKYGGGVEFTHEGKVFHSSVMIGALEVSTK